MPGFTVMGGSIKPSICPDCGHRVVRSLAPKEVCDRCKANYVIVEAS